MHRPRIRRRARVQVLLALALTHDLAAQTPAAAPADVNTIAAIVRASYETIDGPAGQPRQWRRDSTLYMPGATFVAVGERNDSVRAAVMTPEEYRRRNFADFARDGLFETEIGRHIERFGNVAQVRSVAVSRRTKDGPVRERYVNYFQVYWDGARWWIAGMVWDQETKSRPIPAAWVGRFDEGPR